jgi:hypothetical protein
MAGKKDKIMMSPLEELFGHIDGTLKKKMEHAVREQKFREQIGDEPITEIHKIVLPWQPGKIKLPLGAGVIHAGEQHRNIHIWYSCQPACTMFQTVPVAVIGTGQKMDYEFSAAMSYYRTVQMESGHVWHIFFGEPEYDPL